MSLFVLQYLCFYILIQLIPLDIFCLFNSLLFLKRLLFFDELRNDARIAFRNAVKKESKAVAESLVGTGAFGAMNMVLLCGSTSYTAGPQ